MAFAHHGVAGFHFVLGGMDISAKFQLGNLFHLEDRENGNDELEVTVKVIPSALDFPPNKSVTAWQPITQMFKEIYTAQGAKVRWDIKQVLVRFRLRANVKVDSTSSPNLLLEALVLPTGTWEAGVPEPKKKLLSSNHSSAIRLWSQDCAWYSPLPHLKLPTAPGISRIALDVPLPSEIKYRWAVQVALRRSDHGKSVVSREEFETYLAAPYPTNIGSSTPFWLPYPFGYMPDDSDKVNSGMLKPVKTSFVRNGKVISRNKTFPQPTRPPKFNTSHKNLALAGSALPADAPLRLKILAGKLFNASIAQSTAKTYSTASSHVSKLETELGRQFSWPLPTEDTNLLLTYLLDKGIQPNTVKSYLAGTRRLAMSKGVASPTPPSDLAKAILKGYENVSRNPVKAVAEATHRPVTIPLLRLLGHAANKYWKGEVFDKQCFWVVCVVAFWGAFRIGELLCEDAKIFSPASDLLGSDVIHMSTSSIALWIRDPKVPKKFGDVVELWSTPQFADVDPFKAFSAYWEQRNHGGFSLSLPLFLMSDSKIFTNKVFNSTLKSLLSNYSMELELSINRWTGHSFRSGLPTLLQAAGFKEEDIKAWGRWASTVFQLYTKDISRRFEVQRTILKVMDSLKAHVEGKRLPTPTLPSLS